MVRQSPLPKAIIWVLVGSVLLMGVPFVLGVVLDRIHPLWVLAGGAAALIYANTVLFPYLFIYLVRDKDIGRERVSTSRSWDAALSPQEALYRIDQTFQDDGRILRSDDTNRQLAFGSEAQFRTWGAFTARGLQALPVLLTVSAFPTQDGAHLTAVARDDLGWSLGPTPSYMTDLMAKANHGILERAAKATQD